MTLTAFSIANFKAFAATQRVPLRPITLIYGANSAGKSSVNAWLGDANRLKTPYELKVRDLLPAEVVSEKLPANLHKVLCDFAASLLKMDEDKMSDLSLPANQVSERVAKVLHIPVTADGEFERAWPNGFFAERAEELF